MAVPKLGLDEAPVLSALLAALKTNLGVSDLKKPPLPCALLLNC